MKLGKSSGADLQSYIHTVGKTGIDMDTVIEVVDFRRLSSLGRDMNGFGADFVTEMAGSPRRVIGMEVRIGIRTAA